MIHYSYIIHCIFINHYVFIIKPMVPNPIITLIILLNPNSTSLIILLYSLVSLYLLSLLFILSFYPFITRRELYIDIHSRSLVIFFLFNIFALGSIGDPIPFIFLALAYRSVIEPNSRLNE